MSLSACPFCSHGNPADAKFCSACGGQVNLVPCPHCAAVNDIVATTCYHCKRPLRGRANVVPDAAPGVAPVSVPLAAPASRPVSRPTSRVLVGTLVLGTMAALGYIGYTQFFRIAPAPPPTAGSASSDRSGSVAAGVIGREVATGDVTPAKAEVPALPASPAAAPSEAPPADPAFVAPVLSRAARRAADAREAKEAKAAADLVAPSPAADAGRPGGQQQTRQEPCTAAAAALGLCVAKDVTGADARAQAGDTGKAAGGQEPPRQQVCTEAVAALGLCTPGPK
jgi:hypothetical protein